MGCDNPPISVYFVYIKSTLNFRVLCFIYICFVCVLLVVYIVSVISCCVGIYLVVVVFSLSFCVFIILRPILTICVSLNNLKFKTMGLNISKIYNNKVYSDNLVLIAVKQGLKQRKLKREDLVFLKKKAYIKDDEFGMNLLNTLPLSNPYWRLPDTRTQAYLKRKRRESIPSKK